MAQKSSLLPWWGKVLVGFMLLIMLLLLVEFALGVIKTNSWNRYAAGLRDEGILLTYAEIEAARETIPKDENSAPVLLEIFQDVKSRNMPKRVRYDLIGGITAEQAEKSRKIVAENQALLDKLKRMRDYPRGRFDIGYPENPLVFFIPEVTTAQHAAELAYHGAVLALINGDNTLAIQWIEVEANIAGALYEHPTMVGRAYQASVDDIVVSMTEALLQSARLTDAELQALSEILDRRRGMQSMRIAFLGDLAFVSSVCDALDRGVISRHDIMHLGDGSNRGGVSWLPTFLIRSNQKWAVEQLVKLVRATDDPKALLRASERHEDVGRPQGLTNYVVRSVMASYSRAVLLHVRLLARLEAMRVALAAERFYVDHGRYPDSLADLVPTYIDAIPLDPFTDKPMRMATAEDGIVIYSVGENEKDDRGDIGHTTRWEDRGDFGVRLVVPEGRGIRIVEESDEDGT